MWGQASSESAMKRLVAILVAIALFVPLIAMPASGVVSAQEVPVRIGPQTPTPGTLGPAAFGDGAEPAFRVLDEAVRGMEQNQVRIERRVVIRVSPAPPRARTEMLAELPRRPMPRMFQEVAHGDCLEVNSILGVQPMRDNRLLFFTRDGRILAAGLERSCNASAFYAGFYVEQSEDGRLCVARDRLQSRAGSACELSGFTRLVAANR